MVTDGFVIGLIRCGLIVLRWVWLLCLFLLVRWLILFVVILLLFVYCLLTDDLARSLVLWFVLYWFWVLLVFGLMLYCCVMLDLLVWVGGFIW